MLKTARLAPCQLRSPSSHFCQFQNWLWLLEQLVPPTFSLENPDKGKQRPRGWTGRPAPGRLGIQCPLDQSSTRFKNPSYQSSDQWPAQVPWHKGDSGPLPQGMDLQGMLQRPSMGSSACKLLKISIRSAQDPAAPPPGPSMFCLPGRRASWPMGRRWTVGG